MISLVKQNQASQALHKVLRVERNNLIVSSSRSLNIYTAEYEDINNLLPYLRRVFSSLSSSAYLINYKSGKDRPTYRCLVLVQLYHAQQSLTEQSFQALHKKRLQKMNRRWGNISPSVSSLPMSILRVKCNRDVMNAVFASFTHRLKTNGLGNLLFKGHSWGW